LQHIELSLAVGSSMNLLFIDGSPKCLKSFSSVHLLILRWSMCTTLLFTSHLALLYVYLGYLERKKSSVIQKFPDTCVPSLLEKVKFYSYRWLKATTITLISNYHNWWSSRLFVWALTNFVTHVFSWMFCKLL
jgi:hypothetical protein